MNNRIKNDQYRPKNTSVGRSSDRKIFLYKSVRYVTDRIGIVLVWYGFRSARSVSVGVSVGKKARNVLKSLDKNKIVSNIDRIVTRSTSPFRPKRPKTPVGVWGSVDVDRSGVDFEQNQ